ncbi:hypothetical protein RJT34_15891 [Clitoria ternatea]|uniref:Ubiquitin-like protease family profile domain-containing protein n=1 Tax=Clitoria ternatea TaxID=43366 RepID=A0AAN9PBU5_CLITE
MSVLAHARVAYVFAPSPNLTLRLPFSPFSAIAATPHHPIASKPHTRPSPLQFQGSDYCSVTSMRLRSMTSHNEDKSPTMLPKRKRQRGNSKMKKVIKSLNEDKSLTIPQKRKGQRGDSKMKKVIKAKNEGKKLPVGWNTKKQPINPNKALFVNYIGHVTRNLVPITYYDWDNVPNDIKDIIWNSVAECFDIDDSRKKFVLSAAGQSARSFRAKLTKRAIDEDGNFVTEVPAKYARIISEDVWKEFANRCGSEEFKKLSKENAQRAKSVPYKYRKAAKGYAIIEQEMLAESGSDMTCIPRHVLWKEGRVNKNGDIVDENVQRVWEQCENLSQSMSQLESKGPTRDDILAKVLNVPEHPGRVRGVGFGVCQRDVFNRQKQPRPTKEEFEQLKIKLDELTQMVVEMRQRHLCTPMSEPPQPQQCMLMSGQSHMSGQPQTEQCMLMSGQSHMSGKPQPCIPMPEKSNEQMQIQPKNDFVSGKGGCTPMASLDIPEGEHACYLFLSTPTYRMVAKGKVYNLLGNTLHNASMLENHARVSIDFLEQDEENTELPVPNKNDSLITLGDALSTLVSWPIHLISLQNQTPTTSERKGKEPGHTKESATSPTHKSACQSLLSSGARGLPYCTFLEYYVQNNSEGIQLPIPMPLHICNVAFDEQISAECIDEILQYNLLSASTICVYMRFLYDHYLHGKELEAKFSFMSPHMLSEHNEDHTHQYVANVLNKFVGQNKLIMTPYKAGNHWVLVAINVLDEMIYYLDSVHDNHKGRSQMTNMFNGAISIYRALRRIRIPKAKVKLKWSRVVCPRQENDVDSGYYVMRFMKEIVHMGQTMIPEKYFQEYQCATYTEEQLDEVREDWSSYVFREFIKKN